MKKIFFIVAFLATAFSQRSFAQDSNAQNQLFGLLSSYYNIKDALVAGNASAASQNASDFIKMLNSIDYKIISEGNVNAVLKDATPISETKDIKKQRECFVNFSNNMATLAKSLKLSGEPVYQVYCPMKKANWLSRDKSIKNPYFGNAMLSCGKVVETIDPQ
jgi:DNA-binding transcriptional regulator WhiA